MVGAKRIQTIYCGLTGLNTLAASFIWGVNTLFLLDAGLTNSQAFAANAFFTLGQVVFEIPTGVVADTMGRRASYLIGSLTLFVTTVLYLFLWQAHGPFWAWALVSAALGLGFTFFSGAVEAWLVDALVFEKFEGAVDDVFAKGQIASGTAMLVGSTLGGYLASKSNLGVPYIFRSAALVLSFAAAWIWMKDLGFTPRKPNSIATETHALLRSSFKSGLGNPPVRWMILVGPAISGVGIYAFYAAQPLLLELYGDSKAYGIAGLIAALVAGTQILGGIAVPYFRRFFSRRSSLVMAVIIGSVLFLSLAGIVKKFAAVLVCLALWSFLGAILVPVRRAYLNGLISSSERATVLSFDGMLSSVGGVLIQPALGRSADLWGYSASYIFAGGLQLLALPFAWLVRRENSKADQLEP
jgi:MFS family permease